VSGAFDALVGRIRKANEEPRYRHYVRYRDMCRRSAWMHRAPYWRLYTLYISQRLIDRSTYFPLFREHRLASLLQSYTFRTVVLLVFTSIAQMSQPPINKTSTIVIVGAGVFGLSTAIHLAKRGYTNVTVLDKQPYKETHYSYASGCDAASAGRCPL
jgi:FAD dependent oxidoreductase